MKLTLIFSGILYGLPLLILLRPFRHRLWVSAWFFWVIGFGGVLIDYINSPSAVASSMLPIWLISGPVIGVIYSVLLMGVIEGIRQSFQLKPALQAARAKGLAGTVLWKDASQEIARSRKSILLLPRLLQPGRIIACFIATFLVLMLTGPMLASRPTSGVNLASVSWLPKEATHVSFFKSTGNKMYEFDIPEPLFLKWIVERQFTGTTNSGGMVRRWTATLPPEKLGTNSSLQIITNGIVVTHHRADGGGYDVGYDRSLGRAFVSENSH